MQRVTPPPAPPERSSWREFWRTWVLGALLPVYLVTTFLATFARVNGESMAPSCTAGSCCCC